MIWTPTDIGDLTGRTALVTGANGGLGLETARELARAGAKVFMGARDQAKAAAAVASIEGSVPNPNLRVVELDLSSLDSVNAASDMVKAETEQLDIVVNNAGIMAVPPGVTDDDYERQMGINYLGHFALTAQLLPLLLGADAARVVSVSSIARYGTLNVGSGDLKLDSGYGQWSAYSKSKLANAYFGLELNRRFAEARLPARSIVAHPGLTNSDLQSKSYEVSGGLMNKFWELTARWGGMSTSFGAHSQLRAATDPGIRGGWIVGPAAGIAGPPVARPALRPWHRSAKALFAETEDETGIRYSF